MKIIRRWVTNNLPEQKGGSELVNHRINSSIFMNGWGFINRSTLYYTTNFLIFYSFEIFFGNTASPSHGSSSTYSRCVVRSSGVPV